MAETSISSINPLSGIDLGGKIGTFGGIALVVIIVAVILALIGFFIYMLTVRKQYYIKIKVFRNVGNIPTRVGSYVARTVSFGRAGDYLWRVAPDKVMQKPFKILKWLPVGELQSAPNEFWYFIREDGEWVNFVIDDLNQVSKLMNVKFVSQDMRLQRLATERLLEQRLMDKGFWDKWGTTIMTMIFFLVVSVCMVIIFYQWGKLLDKTTLVMQTLDTSMKIVANKCGSGYIDSALNQSSALIPV